MTTMRKKLSVKTVQRRIADELEQVNARAAKSEKKKGRGRPQKLNKKVQALIIEALEAGNYRIAASRAAGVSYRSFIGWMNKGENARGGEFRVFYDAVVKAETTAETEAVSFLYRRGKKEPQHLKWWLTHRHRERWADNISQGKVEITGKGGGPLVIEDARKRLVDRLDALAAKRGAPKPEEKKSES